MGDLTITPERSAIIDFTVSFQTEQVIVLSRKPEFRDSSLFTMFKPFAIEVWIAILVSLITGISLSFSSLTIRLDR